MQDYYDRDPLLAGERERELRVNRKTGRRSARDGGGGGGARREGERGGSEWGRPEI